ncbi:RHS repeat-associated core domain-containing protein [Pseudomonas sp. PB3P13]
MQADGFTGDFLMGASRVNLCHYRYNPLDLLTVVEPTGQPPRHRFYCRERLANELQGASSQSVLQQGNQLLALQSRDGDGIKSQLLTTDLLRSVLQVTEAGGSVPQVYSPYGHRGVESGLGSLLGFAGEALDPLTGHYLLGNGRRAFNPVLMRFNSPDELSPFGRGGLNPYAYCLGDPVNRSDPTGRVSELNLVGIILSGVVLATSLVTLFPAVPFMVARSALRAGILKSGQSARLKVGAVSGGLAGPLAALGAGFGVARAVTQEVDPDSPALKYLAWGTLLAGSAALLARGGSYWAARDPKTNPALVKYVKDGKASVTLSGQQTPPTTPIPSAPPLTPPPPAPPPSPGSTARGSFSFPEDKIPTIRNQ